MLEEKSGTKNSLDVNSLVTIVIPILNEEQGIARVIQELNSVGLRNILVVDGYSRDKSVDIAKQSGARVIFQQGKGKTGALKTSIDHVDTPFILVIDGDFTYEAASIERLLLHMKHYDEIIGARVPINSESMTRLHKFGNNMITKLFNILLSTNLSDVCSGLYLLKTSSVREINLSTSGFDVEVEIAAQIASSGRITEVPINYRPRLGVQKLSTWRSGFKIIRSIFRLARSYNPGVFYSMLSSLLVIPAGCLIASSLVEWLFTQRLSQPYFFLGLSMLLVAVQCMTVGMVSLVMRRSEIRISRKLALATTTEPYAPQLHK